MIKMFGLRIDRRDHGRTVFITYLKTISVNFYTLWRIKQYCSTEAELIMV